jgi:hypothetical protein
VARQVAERKALHDAALERQAALEARLAAAMKAMEERRVLRLFREWRDAAELQKRNSVAQASLLSACPPLKL